MKENSTMTDSTMLYVFPKSGETDRLEMILNGTKFTLCFENTVENPQVFKRIEEILLAACELK